jgi:hypothetical protein
MAVVQVSALARNGGVPRGECRADVLVPKPFTPRQIVDAARTALARRAARRRVAMPTPSVPVGGKLPPREVPGASALV